jgi:outer membrane biosynthesis protein TonB
VLDVKVDSSSLPAFDDFVRGEVAKWRFTPPTRQGLPVKAQARLPIPIQIQ